MDGNPLGGLHATFREELLPDVVYQTMIVEENQSSKIQYDIICHLFKSGSVYKSFNGFSAIVNNMIGMGWIPLGGVVTNPMPHPDIIFCQAVVRKLKTQ